MTLIERLLAQANKEANELSDLLNEAAQALAQPKQEVAALFREALAFGLVCGPEIPAHQWDEMREEKVAQLVSRLAAPPAKPQQEPVPVFELEDSGWEIICDGDWIKTLPVGTKLYTSPPPREPLTYGEIDAIALGFSLPYSRHSFVRAIEATHGIKDTPC
jgi:hypothetical protein